MRLVEFLSAVSTRAQLTQVPARPAGSGIITLQLSASPGAGPSLRSALAYGSKEEYGVRIGTWPPVRPMVTSLVAEGDPRR